MKGNDIISKIRNNQKGAIIDLYNSYKDEFVRWSGHKYQIQRDDALDIFQEVIISFYESIKMGKLQRIDYQVKTYLFAMAKNMIFNRLKFDKRFKRGEETVEETVVLNAADHEIELTDRHRLIINQLEDMGEPCYSILKLFFYDSFSMEAIAQNLNYKNSDVVKSQKLRCINELRKKVKMLYTQEDL